MNLIIDIGNSSVKLSVYDGQKREFTDRKRSLTQKTVTGLTSRYSLRKAIISSVRSIPWFLTPILDEKMEYVHILSHKSRLPFPIEYKTPLTLGPDRIAAMAGAWSAFNGADTLVIDAGTAITYDLLESSRYHGGSISPGIKIRFRALNKFTGRLPLVTGSNVSSLTGTTTEEAINAGVISGVVFEINEYIRTFVTKYPGIKVVMTGGDAGFLKGNISEDALYMPDIVADGLNFILEYNAK